MAGILDKKSRVLDAIVTPEGRRQLAAGTFNISYATFSDGEVFYISDDSLGHLDPTDRLTLEACGLPQDQIVLEANDEGRLAPLRKQYAYINPRGFVGSGSTATVSVKDGKLYSFDIFHGRVIKFFDIAQNYSDNDKGFIYSDYSGTTGSILIDPSASADSYSAPSGGPYKGKIGTKNGILGNEFAKRVSITINQLSASGGPIVSSSYYQNSVYLPPMPTVAGDKYRLIYTGSLATASIILQEELIGGRVLSDELEAEAFASQIRGILSSSFDNFMELRTISTIDRLLLDNTFVLSTNEIQFDAANVKGGVTSVATLINSPPQLNSIDSLFNDDKLSRTENFMYLPPIVKTSPAVAPNKSDIADLKRKNLLLGNYPSWGDNESRLDYTSLQKQLSGYQFRDVSMVETSVNNSVMAQLFEVSKDGVRKLDVIDFGDLPITSTDESRGDKTKVFFAGKVYVDDRGTTCFVNMFTLMFSKRQGDDE